MEQCMQQLTFIQAQTISGGKSNSLSSFGSDTANAFKKGLSSSELGVGLVSFALGAALTALPPAPVLKGLAFTAVAGYAVYSYCQNDDTSTFTLPSVSVNFS
jgi:hypothetical protein